MEASFIILGSGQDGGSPQFGASEGVGPSRTASSVAVRTPAGAVVLLDASPDIRRQSRRLLAWDDLPAERTSLIDGVAITHAHMGHYAGLLHFGREAVNTTDLPLLATPSFVDFLGRNQPWSALLSGGHVSPRDVLEPVVVDETTTIRGIPVPHRAEYTDTVAISVIVGDEPWLCYLPDIDSWDEWPEAESVLAGHRYALVDATFSSPEELPGRDIASIPHPFVTDTVSRFSHLTSERTIILTHINHSNPVADPASRIARDVTSLGFHVAHDGMQSSNI